MQMVRYLILLFVLALIAVPAAGQSAGSGRSFILTQPYVTPSSRGGAPSVRLLITSRSGADVQLYSTATGATATFTVAPNSSEERVLDNASILLPESEGTFRNTIQVSSSAPVTAALMIDQDFSQEAYNAIPDTLLGFEYRAVSSEFATQGSVLTVIGISDTTRVTITPIVGTLGGRPANVPFVVMLNRGEVYQMLTPKFVDVDITGSLVVGDKPIGVVGGAQCAQLPYGYKFGSEYTCNPMIEQFTHVDSWGREFVVAPLAGQQVAPYRVIATCDNTAVLINGQEVARLNHGEFYAFAADALLRVQTSEPSMLMQQVTNTAQRLQDVDLPSGDPSMIMVAPRNQWHTGFSVLSPSLAPRLTDISLTHEPVEWKHYVQIAAPLIAEASIRLDGVPVTWVSRVDNGNYVVGAVEVAPGYHAIDASMPVCASTYGYSSTDAYGYTLGAATHQFRLRADDILAVTCNDQFDTTFLITNVESDDAVITGAEFVGNLEGDVLSPGFPFTVPAGGSLYVTVRLKNLFLGKDAGYLVLRGGSCRRRLLAMKFAFLHTILEDDRAAGSLIDFGTMATSMSFVDSTITLYNRGNAPLPVALPVLSVGGQFVVASPAFPLVIPPRDSVKVTVRFAPTAEGIHTDTLLFQGCSDTLRVPLRGRRKSGAYIDAIPADSVRMLCAPKLPDTLRVEIRNTGDQPMTITDGNIIGDAASEFGLITSVAGVTIPPGASITVTVIYTPAGAGARQASLRIVSNAVDDPLLLIPFDVRNDVIRLDALDGALDLGGRLLCDGNPPEVVRFVNRGNLPVDAITATLGSDSTGTVSPGSFGAVAVGDTIELMLQLGPDMPRDVADTITVSVMPCGDTLRIPVRARRLEAAFDVARDTIDFGMLMRCDSLREIALPLHNRGDVADSIAIDHLPAVPGLAIVDPVPVLTIGAGKDDSLLVRYVPVADGRFLDSIVMISQPCAIRRVVVVRGEYESAVPSLSADSIDFGTSVIGAPSRRTVTIVNHSSVPRSFGALAMPGIDSIVRAIRPAGAFTIPPGDSVEIELEYLPKYASDSLDTAMLIVETAPCSDPLRVALRGVTRQEVQTAKLSWQNGSTLVGTETILYLRIDSTVPQGQLDTFRLITTLRYNASLFSPRGVTSLAGLKISTTGDRVVAGQRYLTFDVLGVFPQTGPIVELRVLATLGDTDRTPLVVEDVLLSRVPSGTPITLSDTADGEFQTLGLCPFGPSRFVAPTTGMFRLEGGRPNPIAGSATIEFETVENGPTSLRLLDARGRDVGTLLEGDILPGIYQAQLDASMLPSGSYWLVLTSPTQIARRSIMVVK